MALTEAQKTSIRHYLGWPDRFLETNSDLELALRAAEDKPSTVEKVEDLLGILDTVDTALRDSGVRLRLQAVKVGTLELPGGAEIDRLRDLGRQYSGQLATLLSVAIMNDAWSPSAPGTRAGVGGLSGTGGGEIPFG